MDSDSITRFIAETFAGVDVVRPDAGSDAPEIAWGDTFFIYDPDRNLTGKDRFPFATIVTKDYGDFDRAGQLDRPGVFRLNIGVTRETYAALFGAPPSRAHTAADDTTRDFSALDTIMPHPVYAPQSWIGVLNPSDTTFESVRPLIAEAHGIAASRHARRSRSA